MRVRRLALAAAALPLALALAACSGGAAAPEATSTPAPTATPAETSTSAPTAAATPAETSTSAPTATPAETGAGSAPVPGAASLAACSNGAAIPALYISEGQVRDCALLLDVKDVLRGTAPLNWSARVPMAEWEGVRVGARGTGPLRVTGISLRGKGLTGVIPPQLGYLTGLTALDLADNGLTGAIPPGLANLTVLEQFLAGGNRLTGTIPDLSRLTMLRRLDLRGNGLAGGIPAWLADARELAVLRLDGNRLGGPVPRGIGRLPLLSEVTLAGNALTGCVPSPLEDIESDAASLGLPWCLRYDRLDAAGEAAEAGEWAILGSNGEVLTTWEQLRSEAATLRVHQTDAGGTSWVSEFGAVAVNDLFEWRKSDDCWVRYRVTDAPVAPSGASGRWEFPIEWMTYAATGAGCKGAVGAGAVLSADEAPPDVIPATFIDAPLRHGPWLLTPHDWEGPLEEPVPYRATESAGASGAAAASSHGVHTTDIAVARGFPLWREPALPAGWRFDYAEMGTIDSPADGYRTAYVNELGYFGTMIYVTRRAEWPYPVSMHDITKKGSIREARMIDGHWALVKYVPPLRLLDANHGKNVGGMSTEVRIFIEPTGIIYTVQGLDRNFLGGNVEPVIEIARSLYGGQAR